MRKTLADLRWSTVKRMFSGQSNRVIGPYTPDKDGYLRTVVIENGTVKTKATARLLLELALGRQLRANEYVRYVDGDFSNLNLENLAIVSPSLHFQLLHKPRSFVQKVLRENTPFRGGVLSSASVLQYTETDK